MSTYSQQIPGQRRFRRSGLRRKKRHSSFSLSLALVGLFACAVPSLLAAPPPAPVLRYQDAGHERAFELALDEALVTAPGESPVLQTIPARLTREELFEQLRITAATTGEDIQPVLYSVGYPRTDANRRVVTTQVLVQIDPVVALDVGGHTGVLRTEDLSFASDYQVVHTVSALDTLDVVDELQAMPGVRYAQPLLGRLQQTRWVPDDPLFPEQWHLVNTGQAGGQPGIDVRVANVWAAGYLGSNVVIAIIDDGLEHTHPDLEPNYVADHAYNWNGSPGNRYDPMPGAFNRHGTACAGISAARGGNAIGVTGVAPWAQLTGLRLIASYATDLDKAEAMAHHNEYIQIKNNSWGPWDDGERIEAPGVLTAAALAEGVVSGRNGRGVLYVWAGGNGQEKGDNSNYDGYANSIYTISVAALSNEGEQTGYSEPGACNVVTAPSKGGTMGMVTTDLEGERGYNYTGQSDDLDDIDYTKTFGGTSSAAPLVAGIVALMIEANPDLSWRDVQELLIRTARIVDEHDDDWRVNDAGLHFNHKYGAGLVDAEAAVLGAVTWSNLPPSTSRSVGLDGLGLTIPDNHSDGVTVELEVDDRLQLEHVTLTLDITHPHRGQLDIRLTGPGGMESVLAEPRPDPNPDYPEWTFMTVRHWGESATGTWTLTIRDLEEGSVGTLHSARLELHGVAVTPVIEIEPEETTLVVAVDSTLTFTVRATDVHGGGVWMEAQGLPAGASAPSVTGTGTVTTAFEWTPTTEQAGAHVIPFVASNFNGVAVLEAEIDVIPWRTFMPLRMEPEHVNDTREPVVLAGIAPGPAPLWAVALAWRVNTGDWQFLTMTSQSTVNGVTTYAGTLPTVEAGAQVEYYVYATDFELQTVYSETNTYSVGISTFRVHPNGWEEYPYNTWERALRHPQDALALAADGQRILVADGAYTGQTLTIDRAVTLESVNGWASTTISGQGLRQCLVMNADAVVRGFTFTQGFSPQNGGAIEMSAGRLEESLVTDSHALQNGGGIAMFGGLTRHVSVCHNHAMNAGGVFLLGGRIENALIHDNQAGENGGGLLVGEGSESEHCTIAFNHAGETGGGIFMDGWEVQMMHHIIVSNTATVSDPNWKRNKYAQLRYTITAPDPEEEGSFDLDPLFAHPASRDFRLRSEYGRYTDSGEWVLDDVTSPAIDMGSPFSPFDLEPAPNGGRVNIGAYGNTPYASKGTDDHRKLLIVSKQALVDPEPGLITVARGTEISSAVVTAGVTNGLTRHLAKGWRLVGQEDLGGDLYGTNLQVSVALNENAILTWRWSEEHYVSAQGEHGHVEHQDDWYALGRELSLRAVPDEYYAWGIWSGTVSGTNNPLALVVDQPHAVEANFDPLRTAQGTPFYWLASYGWTNDFEVVALEDTDGDGMLNWQEYIAGTDPLDEHSFLRVNTYPQDHETIARWSVVPGRRYRLLRWNDLMTLDAEPLFEFEASSHTEVSVPLPIGEEHGTHFFAISVEYD